MQLQDRQAKQERLQKFNQHVQELRSSLKQLPAAKVGPDLRGRLCRSNCATTSMTHATPAANLVVAGLGADLCLMSRPKLIRQHRQLHVVIQSVQLCSEAASRPQHYKLAIDCQLMCLSDLKLYTLCRWSKGKSSRIQLSSQIPNWCYHQARLTGLR